jgi:site-specific recombinase XerD
MKGIHWLMASFLCGSGMRLFECPRLRVKNMVKHRQILVRNGKGNKDRVIMLPQRLIELSQHPMAPARRIH